MKSTQALPCPTPLLAFTRCCRQALLTYKGAGEDQGSLLLRPFGKGLFAVVEEEQLQSFLCKHHCPPNIRLQGLHEAFERLAHEGFLGAIFDGEDGHSELEALEGLMRADRIKRLLEIFRRGVSRKCLEDGVGILRPQCLDQLVQRLWPPS